jgi:ATP-dependent Clp protease adaptor protein ClpS
MSPTQTSTDVVVSTKTELKPPSLYDVIFFNDNKTHYEFVLLILMHIFGKNYDTAMELTNQIHDKGREVVATYSYEIASTKRDETISTARANGHPLRVEIEPSSSDGDEH